MLFGKDDRRSDHIFRDRVEAGRELGERLARFSDQNVLVLGIPRGGVPIAAEVARRLGADLDIIVARKLGAPGSPELAIGAVTANGGRFLNDDLMEEFGVTERYLEKVTAQERAEAHRREERFRGDRRAQPAAGRTVIVVDDGLATGATMRAAVRSIRSMKPQHLVVAVPVGSTEACEELRAEADEVVCLYQPEPFWAVGLYYRHFEPTEDADVQRILSEWYEATEAA
jgi:predicted phosphoribosyltransferase